MQRIPNAENVRGKPFVIVINGTKIYLGAIWTTFSSLSFGRPVIERGFQESKTELQIKRSYPHKGAAIGTDPRHDERIEKASKAEGKLIN